MTATRATHMQIQDVRLLEDWGRSLRQMFPGEVAYLVGSALTASSYRDVDVRLIFDDAKFDALDELLSIPRLNMCLSIWGRHVTGLPIDCQIQQMTEANELFGRATGSRRHPIGISRWDEEKKGTTMAEPIEPVWPSPIHPNCNYTATSLPDDSGLFCMKCGWAWSATTERLKLALARIAELEAR